MVGPGPGRFLSLRPLRQSAFRLGLGRAPRTSLAPLAPAHRRAFLPTPPPHPFFAPLHDGDSAYVSPDAADSKILLVGGTGGILTAVAGAYFFKQPEVIKASVSQEELQFLCEGRRGLLCKYTGERSDWQGHLLQLRKASPRGDDGGLILVRRAATARSLASHCLPASCVDVPEVVALPVATIRGLQAQLLRARSQRKSREALSVEELDDCPGRVVGLRRFDLFEPVPRSAVGSQVAIEVVVGEEPTEEERKAEEGGSCGLFTTDRAEVAQELVRSFQTPDRLRSFCDGHPVASTGVASGGVFADQVDFANAAAAAIVGSRVMKSINKLQSLASADCDALVGRVLEELLLRGGQEGIENLKSLDILKEAIASVGRFPDGHHAAEKQAAEAVRLLGREQWGDKDIRDAQKWLLRLLLGRGAIGCHLLVRFVRPKAVDASLEKKLRSARFAPVTAGDGYARPPHSPSSTAVLWASCTVTSLEPDSLSDLVLEHLPASAKSLVEGGFKRLVRAAS